MLRGLEVSCRARESETLMLARLALLDCSPALCRVRPIWVLSCVAQFSIATAVIVRGCVALARRMKHES